MNRGPASTTATREQARRAIDAVLAASPEAALASLGITLVVRRSPLRTPRRIVHGAWDPLLARIELFDCDRRSDAELVTTFVHELLHALAGLDDEQPSGDAAIHRRALAVVVRLSDVELSRFARQLRAAAHPPVVRPERGDGWNVEGRA